ncbi:MAG: sugar kinase [Litoreibacter sp.]
MKILCMGEAMVEMAPLDVAGILQRGFAGDTLNTAWYLKRAQPSWSVDYFTGVGDDVISEQMLGFMSDSGIGVDTIVRVPDRTVGLYMIDLKDGERSFSYWRSTSAARKMADDPSVLASAFSGYDMIYVSGITIAVLEGAGLTNLIEALKAARANGVKIVFDSNLRPRLWPSNDVMCKAVMAAAECADVVLPSYDDEAEFFGDVSPEACLQRYREAGCATVIVKNGPGEILYCNEGTEGRVCPVPVTEVVDTTAAGDSFNAGFLGALDQGVEPAILAGSLLAGRVIGGRGALVEL